MDKHRYMRLSLDVGYAFAKNTNVVPAVVGEVPWLSSFYPIVFARMEEGGSYTLLSALHFAKNSNAYVNRAGEWLAEYIPLYIRKYPFMTANVEGDSRGDRILCFDPKAQHFNKDTGKKIFKKNGDKSDVLASVLNIVMNFDASQQQTQSFCEQVAEANILQKKQENSTFGNVQFYTIDLEALSTLSIKKIHAWKDNGYLNSIHHIIYSQRCWREIEMRIRVDQERKVA